MACYEVLRKFEGQQLDSPPPETHLLDFPAETLQKIFGNLSVKDLCAVSLTCKGIKNLTAYSLRQRAKKYGYPSVESPTTEQAKLFFQNLFDIVVDLKKQKFLNKNELSFHIRSGRSFTLKRKVARIDCERSLLKLLHFPKNRLWQMYENEGFYKVRNIQCLHLFLLNNLPKLRSVNNLNSKIKDDLDYPFFFASIYNDHYAMELLLGQGADPNFHVDRYQPLLFHTAKGNTELVNLLLDYGTDPNMYSGNTPLHHAARVGHADIAKSLAARVESINERGKGGATPLYYAVKNNNQNVVRFLLEIGADPNSPNDSGYTPLAWACIDGLKDIASLLLEYGADPNIPNHSRRCTPLHHVASLGHTEIMELLLENGADIHATTLNGRTPLWFATLKNHHDAVMLLRQKGASPLLNL